MTQDTIVIACAIGAYFTWMFTFFINMCLMRIISVIHQRKHHKIYFMNDRNEDIGYLLMSPLTIIVSISKLALLWINSAPKTPKKPYRVHPELGDFS